MNFFEASLWLSCAGIIAVWFGGYAVGYVITKLRERGDSK